MRANTLVFELSPRDADFLLVTSGAIEIFETGEHSAEHLVTRHKGQFSEFQHQFGCLERLASACCRKLDVENYENTEGQEISMPRRAWKPRSFPA